MRRNNVFIETLTARGGLNFGSAPGGAYTGDGLLDFMLGYMSCGHGRRSTLAWEAQPVLVGRLFPGRLQGQHQSDCQPGDSLRLFPALERDARPLGLVRPGHEPDGVFAANASEAQGGRALTFGDKNNWGPRFGFAWRPLGRQNTVVRGGYGVYFEQEHPSGPILHAINPPPGGLGAAGAEFSGFGFTRDYIAPALSVNPQPTLFWNNFATGSAALPARVAVNAADPKMRDTYVQQWNFALQHQVGQNSFEVGYVANKANKIFTSENVNTTGRLQLPFHSGHSCFDPARILLDQLAHGRWLRPVSFACRQSLSGAPDLRSSLFPTRGATRSAIQNRGRVPWVSVIQAHSISSSIANSTSPRPPSTSDTGSFPPSSMRSRTGRIKKECSARSWAGGRRTSSSQAQTGNATQVSDGTGRADSWSRFDRPDLVADPNSAARRQNRKSVL